MEEILQAHDVPFLPDGDQHHHATAGWIQVDCPFCSPGTERWRLGYCKRGGFFRCWTCGKHGMTETLAGLTGLGWRQCKEIVGEVDVVASREEISAHAQSTVVPKGLLPGLTGPHRKYIRSRGLDPDEIARLWGIRSIGIARDLSHRIYIPVLYRGKLATWTTRSTTKNSRYISAGAHQQAMSPKSLLFGMDYCRHAVIVVEGPFDAFRVGPGAAATMGVGFSMTQAYLLARFPVRVVCFDSSPDAQWQAVKLCRMLGVFPGKTVNVVLDAKDPGDASDREIRRLRRFLE